jgi:hypothetical protein
MDHELPNLKWFSNLRIKVINILFMNFGVLFTSNIYLVALRRVQTSVLTFF